jgi:hypothetical protein
MNKTIRDHIYFFEEPEDQDTQNTTINTKIVPIDYYIENEIINVKKIKHFQFHNNFFYLFHSVEKLEIGKIDEDIYHLKQIHKIKDDTNVLFKFEGKTLVYMENYLQNLTTPRKYIFTLIEFYKHINRALQILVQNKIVCNHINIDSIVVDKFENPLLCNFKFSIDFSRHDIVQHLKYLFIEYDPTYLPWCPELHLLSFILTNKMESLSFFNIEGIFDDCIKHNYLLQSFGPSVVNDFKNSGINYYKKYVNKSVGFIINDIIEYWFTWDNYAISILYLQFLIGIHKKIKKNNKFIIVFMKLLVKNISAVPQNRLTLENTFKTFDNLLYSTIDNDKSSMADLINSI